MPLKCGLGKSEGKMAEYSYMQSVTNLFLPLLRLSQQTASTKSFLMSHGAAPMENREICSSLELWQKQVMAEWGQL